MPRRIGGWGEQPDYVGRSERPWTLDGNSGQPAGPVHGESHTEPGAVNPDGSVSGQVVEGGPPWDAAAQPAAGDPGSVYPPPPGGRFIPYATDDTRPVRKITPDMPPPDFTVRGTGYGVLRNGSVHHGGQLPADMKFPPQAYGTAGSPVFGPNVLAANAAADRHRRRSQGYHLPAAHQAGHRADDAEGSPARFMICGLMVSVFGCGFLIMSAYMGNVAGIAGGLIAMFTGFALISTGVNSYIRRRQLRKAVSR